MNTEIISSPDKAIDATLSLLEKVLIKGDLSVLSSKERLEFIESLCSSLGLNPLTKPFEYIDLNGKLTLYAKKDATDQLRRIHRVSITKLEKSREGDIYTVVAYAQTADGRVDVATGAVNLVEAKYDWDDKLKKKTNFRTQPMKGDNLINAILKCETKAKRRVTLSITGLGLLDESELDTIRNVTPVASVTPQIVEESPPLQLEAIHESMMALDDGPLEVATAPKITMPKGDFVIDGKPCYSGALYSKYLDKVMVCETEEDFNEFLDWRDNNKEAIIAYKKDFQEDWLKLSAMTNSKKELCAGVKRTK